MITAPAAPKRELPPKGNHVARIYSIIHIGTILSDFKNEDGSDKLVNTVSIGWELPNEKRTFNEEKGPQPMVISQDYTLSMNEKANMRKLVQGIIGTDLDEEEAGAFDVSKLMGMECMLQINHKTSKKGSQYAVVASGATIPKGMKVPKAINEPRVLDYDNWNEELFQSLPDFMKDKISSSYQFRSKFNTKKDVKEVTEEVTTEDTPF